jgi:hypothetical protein
MSKVTPIQRSGAGSPPAAGAHIDGPSYDLLVQTLIGYLELRIAYGDASRPADELERLNNQLQALAQRFTPPKGAA